MHESGPALREANASQALACNVRAGLRVALLLSTKRRDVVASWGQFGMLFALTIVSTVLWSLVATGWPARFNHWALPYAVFFLPLIVLASVSVAGIAGRTDGALGLLVAVLAADLWIEAFLTLSHLVSASTGVRSIAQWAPWVLFHLGPAWLAACIVVAAARRFDLPWPRRIAAVPVALAIVAWPLSSADFTSSLWTRADTTHEAVDERLRDAAVREDVLYLQPKLLEQAVAALEPPQPGRPSLYLVGVAGYSGQGVFRREVEAVDELFATRFATRGRSLKLVNNAATLRDTPIASRTGLAYALDHLGTLMRKEDVLFLFLTSHGSKDGRLSLSFPPLRLDDLAPHDLKAMLDAAGIRNRVVVVSACYSGGFADALADDDTMVITASASDRNSFGCSNEAPFTYFGRAYFDEALRTSDSFSEAFDRALPVIAEREKKEDYPPSMPQRRVGARIEAALAGWRGPHVPAAPAAN